MSDDGINIRVMTAQDYPLVKELLQDSFFTGEPLSMSNVEELRKLAAKDFDDYNLGLINHGTSIIAEQQLPGSKSCIVGCIIAGPLLPSDVEKHIQEVEETKSERWRQILKFLSVIEREANIFEKYNIDRTLYSHITTVDQSMRGKGLGTRMIHQLIDLGRAQGYPILMAYCTSFYSARQKEQLGMHCAYEKYYADYKDENGKVIFNPPEPHKRARIMVMKL